jgi:hypothetical protein
MSDDTFGSEPEPPRLSPQQKCLQIVYWHNHVSPQRFAQFLRSHPCTFLSVAAAFGFAADYGRKDNLPGVKVFVGNNKTHISV